MGSVQNYRLDLRLDHPDSHTAGGSTEIDWLWLITQGQGSYAYGHENMKTVHLNDLIEGCCVLIFFVGNAGTLEGESADDILGLDSLPK